MRSIIVQWLESITFNDRITTVEYDYFTGCSGLTSVTFRGTMGQWKEVGGTKVNGAQTWRNGAVYDAIVCTDGSIQRTQDKK